MPQTYTDFLFTLPTSLPASRMVASKMVDRRHALVDVVPKVSMVIG